MDQLAMICYFEKVSHSPVVPLIAGAVVELVESGFYEGVPADLSNDEVMVEYVPETGKVIGFMIFRPDTWRSTWFIMLAWTDPAYRRTGTHTALFEALCERARAKGNVRHITCETHVDNLAAQAAFEKQGRIPKSIYYRYDLGEAAPCSDYTK
nr:MAG TPA: acetyltransferase domain containing protein [Caudoviricetes sp.]